MRAEGRCRTGGAIYREDPDLLKGVLASEEEPKVYGEEGVTPGMPELDEWAICQDCTAEGRSTTQCYNLHTYGERALYARRRSVGYETTSNYEEGEYDTR